MEHGILLADTCSAFVDHRVLKNSFEMWDKHDSLESANTMS